MKDHADDAASGGEYQNPGFVLDHPERQGAATLAQNFGYYPAALQSADCRSTAQIAARPVGLMLGLGIVAQPVPDPPELRRDRRDAAGRARSAFASTRGAVRPSCRRTCRSSTDDPLFFRPELRQDVSARQSAGLRTAAGKHLGRAGHLPPRAAARGAVAYDAMLSNRAPRHALRAVPQLFRWQSARCRARDVCAIRIRFRG